MMVKLIPENLSAVVVCSVYNVPTKKLHSQLGPETLPSAECL